MTFTSPGSRLKPNVRPSRHAAVNKRALEELRDGMMIGISNSAINITQGQSNSVDVFVRQDRQEFTTGRYNLYLLIQRNNPNIRAWAVGGAGGGMGGSTNGVTLTLHIMASTGSGSTNGPWVVWKPGSPLGGLGYGSGLYATFDQIEINDLADTSKYLIVKGSGGETTGKTLTINLGGANRTLSGTNTGDQSAAAQSDMETATDTTLFVTAGTQHFHPWHAKAGLTCTVTPTAVAAAASVDTATEIITWVADHGIADGTPVWPSSATPAGATVNTAYYFHALTSKTGTLHLTLATALAGTSPVNLTTSTAVVFRQLIYTNVFRFGMASQAPVAYVVGTANLNLEFNLSGTLNPVVAHATLQWQNLRDDTAAMKQVRPGFPTVAATIITFPRTELIGSRVAPTATAGAESVALPGNINVQATTAFQVQFEMKGDLT